jgi:1,4-alpha-glucan branching enzyme
MVSRFKTHPARPVPDERPPGDLRGGVHRNLVKPGATTFLLRAPYKPYVSLVGDFNGWNTRTHPMKTDGQGTWWATISDPGRTRYGFYVVVDEDTTCGSAIRTPRK